MQFKCLAVAGGAQGLRRARMAGAEGVDGGGRGGLSFGHCWARGSQGHPRAGQGGVTKTKVPISPWSAPHTTGLY